MAVITLASALVPVACGGKAEHAAAGGAAGTGAGGGGAAAGSGGTGATAGSSGKTTLPTGYYYFVVDVDYLATQLQLYSHIEVDPKSGAWKGLFTNANRRDVLNSRPGCPPGCAADAPICALVPSAKCVKPSEKQTSLEQYVDFLPEPDPPSGYTFLADGSALDQPDALTDFASTPFLIEVKVGTGSVVVQMQSTVLTGAFQLQSDGRWRASGTMNAAAVKLNGVGNAPTQGSFDAMSLSADEVKAVESFGYPIPTLQ